MSPELQEPRFRRVSDHGLENEVADFVGDGLEVLAVRARRRLEPEFDEAEHGPGVVRGDAWYDLEARVDVPEVPGQPAPEVRFPDVEDATD